MRAASTKRYSLRIEGTVQGVGFRPFVYRLARTFELAGWVLNDSQGVLVEVEGDGAVLQRFVQALKSEHPPLSHINRLQVEELPVCGASGFAIVASRESDGQTAQVAPDTYVCPDCLREMFDPEDRRYRYPFINCTNCGPRYSIVQGVPYDRPLTTMVAFRMCVPCATEYADPASRRFHAQPNACPECGPQLTLHDAHGAPCFVEDPLQEAVAALREGQIVAIKGLGGYHLAVDPTSEVAVERLRQRKRRDEKPFALMTRDLESAASFVRISDVERQLLQSVERPIVLLEQQPGQQVISALVAPGNRYLGVMLPYTPLHYLLLESFTALIMTSGNQSDEPIAFDEEDAFNRLQGIADLYLVHNRRIHIRTDDSITRVLAGAPVLLRRSRGYVPRAIKLPHAQAPVLALGAELKNTVCLTSADRATLSHHVGDLKNQAVLDSLWQAAQHLQHILDVAPQIIAHDLHPDYLSTRVALDRMPGLKVPVQHHHAHLASCLADNGREDEAIGVIFDGMGYGSDGHIWGGEFLLGDYRRFERLGHLSELQMPGGDAATREPWRMGVSLLYQTFGSNIPALPVLEAAPENDRRLLLQMLEKRLNAPLTSSCGRLFDAVAALCDLRHKVSFEGQAALELEMVLDRSARVEPYPFPLIDTAGGQFCTDNRVFVETLVEDLTRGRRASEISKAFHLGLARLIVAACERIRARHGERPVVLSGGVFQNVFLTEVSRQHLQEAGFEVLLHRQVPPNDGGLALGQAVIAAAQA